MPKNLIIKNSDFSATPMPPIKPAIKPALGPRWGTLLAGCLIVLAVLAAYSNSFSGPFIFDDIPAIVDNPTIQHLGSAWSSPHDNASGVTSRPLINFSLAVNYALGGFDVRGYHALNLAIHCFAALALFGIVRRTLLQPRLRERFGDAAWWLALAVALLWAVHPLQTESVTCIIQRTESMMGLFYLLTLYCFIRATESAEARGERREARGHPPSLELRRTGSPESGSLPSSALQPFRLSAFWLPASVLCCLLGMASKEVMVSAPLMVLLYDRTFVAGTFREAWKRRPRLYLALACTWLLLGYLVASAGGRRGAGAGFGLGITPGTYALTQCSAILHYLKLSVWPHPLILDYGTKVVPHLAEVLPQALVLVLLVLATILGVWRWPVLGFVGAWFFAILGPSSSVVPLVAQTVAEHRMYLPLASVIVLAVLGLYSLLGRRSAVIFLAFAAGLGCATVQRNQDYRSELAIWSDTAAKCPGNARAHNNLGNVLLKLPGRLPDAMAQFEAALRISPDYAEAHNNLGSVLFKLPGRLSDAIAQYEAALRSNPDLADAHYNLSNALLKVPGRLSDAIAQCEAALRIQPDCAEAHNNLGNALSQIPSRLPNALAEYEMALRIQPDYALAHCNFGNALAQSGRWSEAIDQYEAALRLDPGSVKTRVNLGDVLLKQPGRLPETIAQFEAALQLDPDNAEAHNGLGKALARQGHLAEAFAQFEEAVRLAPEDAGAHYNLGTACIQSGRFADALGEYKIAIRLKPDFAEAHNNLGNALAKLGRMQEAIGQYELALQLKPDFAAAHNNLELARKAMEQPAR